MTSCRRYREDIALLVTGDLATGGRVTGDHAAGEAAGEDLGGGAGAGELEAHLDSCESCAALLESLSGDQALFQRAARQPDGDRPALVAPVLAQAAAESLIAGTFRPPVAPRGGDLGLMNFGRVAAAVALVAAAGLLGYGVLSHGEAPGMQATGADIDEARAPAQSAQAAPATTSGAADAPSTPPPASDVPGAPGASLASAGGSAEDIAARRSSDEPSSDAAQAFRPVRVHRAPGNAVTLEWDGDGREAGKDGAGAYKVLASASPRDFSEARPVLVAGRNLVAGDGFPALRRGDRSVTYFRVE